MIKTIAHVEQIINDDPHTSVAIKSAVALLIVAVKLMVSQLELDNQNSSKPSSTDPNRELLLKADSECPAPAGIKEPAKRGRIKRSKSRNLLERLRNYEDDVLRFMYEVHVPFTNCTSSNIN